MTVSRKIKILVKDRKREKICISMAVNRSHFTSFFFPAVIVFPNVDYLVTVSWDISHGSQEHISSLYLAPQFLAICYL